MREARKRKAISYAESTKSSDGDDKSVSESVSEKEECESDDSMDVDDESEHDASSDNEDDLIASDDNSDAPKKSKKKSSPQQKKGTAKSTVATKVSPAPNKSKGLSVAKKSSSGPTTSNNGTIPRGNSSSSKDNNVNNNVSTTSIVANNIISSSANIGISVDITQGPPVATDAGAKKLITQYMRQQNRPYSAQQLFDNLHKRIPKTTLERVLALLSNPGEGLLCKEYGKAKIYYVDQSFLPSEKSPEQLQELQQTVLELQETLKLKMQEEKERKQTLSALRAEPDDNDLDRLAAELEGRVQSKRQKIEVLQAAVSNGPQLPVKSTKGGKQVAGGGPMNLEQATIQYNNNRKAWVERKALCMNAIDILSEAMGKKPQELISMLDVETDEAAGCSIPPKL